MLSTEPKMKDIITNRINSCDNLNHKLLTLAPSTLRIPISLRLCSAENEARPNKPKQEMMIARQVKPVAIAPSRLSFWNFLLNFSSVKVYSKGNSGLYFL